MKRRFAGFALAVGAALLGATLYGGGRSSAKVRAFGASDRPVTSARAAGDGPVSPAGTAGDPPVTTGPETAEAEGLRRRAAAAAAACDLPIVPSCDAQGCVAILDGPDLDSLTGWLSLVPSRPRFVASIALRDLGVAPAWMPCGDAVAQLAPDGVWSVDRDDGAEVWCVGAPARCDTIAAASYGTAPGAFLGTPRRLAFGR